MSCEWNQSDIFLVCHSMQFGRYREFHLLMGWELQSKWHLQVLWSLVCSLSHLAIRNLCVSFEGVFFFFCSYVTDDIVLVGWCNASLGNETPAFWGRVMSMSSGVRVSKNFSSIFWPPKMILCYLKISVTNYPVTQCHMPEELNPQIICRYRHEGTYSLMLQGNWVNVSVPQMFLTGRCLFVSYCDHGNESVRFYERWRGWRLTKFNFRCPYSYLCDKGSVK